MGNFALISKYRGALMGFAILWILLVHLPVEHDVFILSDIINFGFGGVDIFLFLSGFGLFYAMSKKDASVARFYKRRFLRIFPSFWIFLLATFLIAMRFDSGAFVGLAWKASTLGYWIKKPYFLWYISCITLFYALYPLLHFGFRKYGVKAYISAFLFGLALTFIYAAIMVFHYGNHNVGGLLILSISRIPIFVLGSIFGYLISEKKEKALKIITRLIFALSPFAIAALYIADNYYQGYIWTCSPLFLPFIVLAPAIVILLSRLLDRVHGSVAKVFAWIGSLSLELYIVHEYIYFKALPKIIQGEFDGTTALLAILISFVLAFTLKKISDCIIKGLNKINLISRIGIL